MKRLHELGRWWRQVSVLSFAAFAIGCGVPNLEPPECSTSRIAVREFYSFHFGNDMRFSSRSLKDRERFLSPELVERSRSAPEGTDPFTTGTDDIPKAFRAGECRVISDGRTQFDVVVFWKDDVRSEQKTIKVEMVRSGDKWLVGKVER